MAVTYLIRATTAGPEVLLGEKLTGIGRGKLVGPGGKLEAGESADEAAVREVAEEVGLTVDIEAVTPIARLEYSFPHKPQWSQSSTAFLATRWSGEPQASRELAPRWFALDALPLDRMWDDARLWLPRALAGDFIHALCSYGPDNDAVETWNEL